MKTPELQATPWHRHLVGAVVLGAVGAGAALAFVAVVAAGQEVLWPDPIGPDAWSGSIRILVIMTAAGLVVGLVHAMVPSAEEENVFVALATGQFDRSGVPAAIVIALVTLIAGFSLGPEVPTGMAAAGIAGWVASRRNSAPDDAEAGERAAITGAWGGLFTAPFTAVLLNVELNLDTKILGWRRVAVDAVAAIAGFSVFFAVTASWSDVLRLLDLPPYSLELWQLGVAAGLGVVGAAVGTLFKLSILGTRRLAAPLADRPIVRCTAAGAVLGLLAMALPLTLFLGTEGLADVTDDPEALGAGLILVSVIAKLLATSGALSFGFVGGPVFPLHFAGAGCGAAINVLVPDLPLAFTVTTMMVAVPASVIPVPFSLATLTVLIAGVGATEAAAVFVAAVVALISSWAIEAALDRRARADPTT